MEHHAIKTKTQATFLKTIWQDLDGRHQILQNDLLHVIENKLGDVAKLLNSAIGDARDETSTGDVVKKTGRVHRKAFAIFLKERLEKIVKDLERWHSMFDSSWFLVCRYSSQSIDEQLVSQQSNTSNAITTMKNFRDQLRVNSDPAASQSPIFVTPAYLSNKRNPIPLSSSQISRERENGSGIIVDTIIHNRPGSLATTTQAIRDLARVLSKADPSTVGLLACRGVIKVANEEVSKFELLYAIPDHLKSPRSLRDLLMAADPCHSLDERFGLAKQLAKSVMFVHTSQFVHKNIRPENILVFYKEGSILGVPYLSGFENFRPAAGQTHYDGDNLWEKDLYRHPSRQGLQPEEYYKMQHDIYSLGVCLLEIGLWTPFIIWNDTADRPTTPTTGPDLDNIAQQLSLKDQRKKAYNIKRILVEMAKEQLPRRMGKIYAETVISCLTCLDADNQRFGDEGDFMDEDGILVGVRFIEKVSSS